MKKVARSIAAKLIKDHNKVRDPVVRARYGLLEGWVSILGNLILFAVKIVLGIEIKSAAVFGSSSMPGFLT